MKTKFRFISTPANYNRIFIQTYRGVSGELKNLAFFPIKPVSMVGHIPCGCGSREWNAHNGTNTIHFCLDREIDVEKTDFFAINAKFAQFVLPANQMPVD